LRVQRPAPLTLIMPSWETRRAGKEIAGWSQSNDQRLAFTASAVQAGLGALNEPEPDGLARLLARNLNDDACIEADVSRPRVGARRA
jgi:hypothetical protein